jgi:hypothetical protein
MRCKFLYEECLFAAKNVPIVIEFEKNVLCFHPDKAFESVTASAERIDFHQIHSDRTNSAHTDNRYENSRLLSAGTVENFIYLVCTYVLSF